MKITAQDLLDLGVIDGIIPEPVGGAHRDPDSVMSRTGDKISAAIEELAGQFGEMSCARAIAARNSSRSDAIWASHRRIRATFTTQ
jgi:acetyl-CoA carboxylase alpha subunit